MGSYGVHEEPGAFVEGEIADGFFDQILAQAKATGASFA